MFGFDICSLLPVLVGIASAIIGGIIGYLWRTPKVNRLTGELDERNTAYGALETQHTDLSGKYGSLEGEYGTLQTSYSTLNTNFNAFRSTSQRDLDAAKRESADWKQKHDELEARLRSQQETHHAYRSEQETKLSTLGSSLTRAEQSARDFETSSTDWKQKYEDLDAQLRERNNAYGALETQTSATQQQYQSDLDGWNTRYSDLQSTYEAERSQWQQNETTYRHDLEAWAKRGAEWDLKWQGAQDEIAGLRARAAAASIDPKVREHMAQYDDKIDWGHIGRYGSGAPDDLKFIKGVGPFLEQKLNALGIFTFAQISRFRDADMDLVNEAIQFFPGRIKRDDWVGQATKFMNEGVPDNTPVPFEEYGNLLATNNLQIIEGIGPKTEALLKDNDITDWQAIAERSEEALQEILNSGGSRFKLLRPKSWPTQAAYAHNGQWKELVEYQRFLDTGRETTGDFDTPSKVEKLVNGA